MDTATAFYAVGAALGLGLLVGLQRERAHSELAGFRTFALITVLGAVCGLMAPAVGGWAVAAGFLSVAAATAMGNLIALKNNPAREAGITTEAALLIMFGVGALAAVGPIKVAIATGVAVALLLQGKEHLHGLAKKIGDKDMRAMMVFAAITFVVLPILPDQGYGPMKVLNPHNIWLMVVLVVGISLGGYVAYKVLGQRGGMVLAGLLGGLISSTATTVTYAKRSQENEKAVAPALVVILIASGVVYVRLLGEISVVSQKLLGAAVWPLGVMCLTGLIGAGVGWFLCSNGGEGLPEQENPTQIKPALMFAAMYAVVLLLVAVAREYFGNQGMYVVALVSGLTDTDAITLSTSRLVQEGKLEVGTGWRAIVVALMSNLAFKAGIVGSLGSRRLLTMVVVAFAAQAAAGLAMLLLWG